MALGCELGGRCTLGQVMRHVGLKARQRSPPKAREAAASSYNRKYRRIAALAVRTRARRGRPPRPLIPSRIDDDDFGDAPATLAMRAAAERGKLIHALFERVTDAGSLVMPNAGLTEMHAMQSIDKSKIMADVRACCRQSGLGSISSDQMPAPKCRLLPWLAKPLSPDASTGWLSNLD